MSSTEIASKINELSPSLKLKVMAYINELMEQADEANKSIPVQPKPGLAKGLATIGDNFDAPIEGFKAYT